MGCATGWCWMGCQAETYWGCLRPHSHYSTHSLQNKITTAIFLPTHPITFKFAGFGKHKCKWLLLLLNVNDLLLLLNVNDLLLLPDVNALLSLLDVNALLFLLDIKALLSLLDLNNLFSLLYLSALLSLLGFNDLLSLGVNVLLSLHDVNDLFFILYINDLLSILECSWRGDPDANAIRLVGSKTMAAKPILFIHLEK